MGIARFRVVWVVLGTLALWGCTEEKNVGLIEPEKPYGRPLPPGEKALVKLTDPSAFPDFSTGFERKQGLEQSALYSLQYLSKPSSQQFFPYLDVSHDRATASVEAFLEVLRDAQSPDEFDAMIKDRFDIYMSRGYDEMGTVLFTGYYRPIFDARRQPNAEFRYPLYKRPDDLRRGSKYLTRGEIESGALAGRGLELVWLRDRFETYIITVQGSARLRLEDGSLFDIGYHGDNGLEYSSIGQWLVDQGLINPNRLSLQGLIAFFQQNPQMMDEALAVNQRYVFFTPREGGPFGSLNVPITPFRSIATDNDVYPRAGTAFVQTQIPGRASDGSIRQYRYEGFAMDQDTGGAIRAAGRCDFFLGTGPEMGELAGRTFAEGRLYYIFVKEGAGGYDVMASPPPPDVYEDPGPTVAVPTLDGPTESYDDPAIAVPTMDGPPEYENYHDEDDDGPTIAVPTMDGPPGSG